MDAVEVSGESVTSDLKVARCSTVHFLDKLLSIACRASSKVPSQDKFCVPLNRHKAVGITFERIACDVSFFLASDITPNLVKLHIAYRHILNEVSQKPLAVFASEYQHIENRVPVYVRDSLNAAHTATLNEQTDDLSDSVSRQVCAVQLLGTFAISLVALAATETLITFAVFPKLLAFDFTTVAGHWACLSAKQAR
jgi:hypothetical protein